jgi:excisionase family DNA binding protein
MNIDSNADNLITPQDLSKILGKSLASVYRLTGERKIPFYKIGGSIRFSLTDVKKYLTAGRVESILK